MTDQTDRSLLQSWTLRQDREALGELVRRHIHFVHAAALRQTGDPHLADDVTQAVFILFIRKAHTITSEAAMASWLFTTTRYAAANARRTLRRRRHHEFKAAGQAPTSEVINHQVDNADLQPLLDDAIAHLGSSDRIGVVMNYLQGKPFADVARSLGVSEDAARKRVSRAVDKLRSFLAAQGVSAGAVAITTALSKPSVASSQLIESTLNVAVLSQGASGAGAAGAIAKAVNTMIFATKLKLAAAACLAVVVTTIVAAQVTEHANPPAATPTNAQAVTDPTATLGDGEKVQFVGIAPWPNGSDQWHDINGKTIDPPTKQNIQLQTNGKPAYQTLVIVDGPADIGVNVSTGATSSTASVWITRSPEHREIYMTFVVDEPRDSTDITVSIADEPWKTLFKLKQPSGGVSSMGKDKVNAAFSPLVGKDKGAVMFVSTSGANGPLRLVYTDIDGNPHEAHHGGSAGSGQSTLTEYDFEAPVQEIASVELQGRRFNKTATAKNVPLDPANPTKPQIVVEGAN